MSYERFYPNGWQSGESGGTPITPEAMNHIEKGIAQTYKDFAPAGFGLGGVPTKQISLSELDSTFASGWYWLAAEGATLNGVYFNYATVFVHGMESGACLQEIRPLLQNVVLTRYAYRETFSPWECPNPPMVLGVEYRTTERWNGKVVYAMAVSLGSAINGATVNFGNPDADQLLRVHAFVGENPMPYEDGIGYCRLAPARTAGYIICSTHFVGQDVTAHLFYTKE